jgi:hypothetical protein
MIEPELRKVDLSLFPDCCYVCKYYTYDAIVCDEEYCNLLGDGYDERNHLVRVNTVCDHFEREI